MDEHKKPVDSACFGTPCPHDATITDIQQRLDNIEHDLTSLLSKISEMQSKIYPYSDEAIRQIVENLIQYKIKVSLEKAGWWKAGDEYIAHDPTIIDEKTGLPRFGKGKTVFGAMINLAQVLLFEEYGVPRIKTNE